LGKTRRLGRRLGRFRRLWARVVGPLLDGILFGLWPLVPVGYFSAAFTGAPGTSSPMAIRVITTITSRRLLSALATAVVFAAATCVAQPAAEPLPLTSPRADGGLGQRALLHVVRRRAQPVLEVEIFGEEGLLVELAAPLGCGVQTGVGGIIKALASKPGSSVLITGGGAVGLSAVMGAVIQGCAKIIVVEPMASRRDLALSLGATDVIDPLATQDLAASVRAILPNGIDYAFDTTGQVAGSCGLRGL
jgi:hypothetical protein